MVTAHDIICRARIVLNDEKAVRYTDERLLKFVNEAVDEVFAARPSEAVECITVSLRPGAKQSVPDGYQFVEAVGLGGQEGEGSVGVGNELDETMAKRFGKAPCKAPQSAGDTFTPSAVKSVEYDLTGFVVSPSVPVGVSASLEVAAVKTVRDTLNITDEIPLGHDFHASITDYVLMRAYSIAAESAYHQAQQQFYCNKFYRRLGVGYDGISRVRSGFNFGADGTGNATVGANRDLRGIR